MDLGGGRALHAHLLLRHRSAQALGVPGDQGREILLEVPGAPSVDAGAAKQIRELVTKGATGFTIGFTTNDAKATFTELSAKGVEFTQEPVVREYGTDIGIRDPFGNHIRIVQLAPGVTTKMP